MFICNEDVGKTLGGLADRLANEFDAVHIVLHRLLAADDWSLVIQLYVMLEATVADPIMAKTNEAHRTSIVERLPLHDNQAGKLAIVKQFDLLTKAQLRYIRRASELRNELIH